MTYDFEVKQCDSCRMTTEKLAEILGCEPDEVQYYWVGNFEGGFDACDICALHLGRLEVLLV